MLLLRYRGETTVPIEAECLTPDGLHDKSPAEIGRLFLQYGNAEAPVGDFFAVDGDARDRNIVIEGDCSRVKWIGAGMASGRLTVRGNVGMHLGAEMTGGEIEVQGDAGDWVGAEMRGGKIHVHGSAGHLVGAAYRGSRRGMRGGVILIDGDAGNEIGGVMRRGIIAIGGSVGDFAGVSMIAGTVMVFGCAGIRAGAGMKRGTLVFLGDRPALLPTFRFDCVYQPVFIDLLINNLRRMGFPVAIRNGQESYTRFSGDLVGLGKGEVLVREPPR
jgi:formylmethanofuran dehydrogenase subunit C